MNFVSKVTDSGQIGPICPCGKIWESHGQKIFSSKFPITKDFKSSKFPGTKDFSTRKSEPWLSKFFPRGQVGPNCPTTVPRETNFIQQKNARRAGGKGEELRLQSQEGQELSADAGVSQLILKMTSEHQTVDHTNKIMGNDHGTIFVRVSSNGKTQTLKTVLKRPLVVHTSDQTCVLVFAQVWPAKSHDCISCPAFQQQSCDNVPKTLIWC